MDYTSTETIYTNDIFDDDLVMESQLEPSWSKWDNHAGYTDPKYYMESDNLKHKVLLGIPKIRREVWGLTLHEIKKDNKEKQVVHLYWDSCYKNHFSFVFEIPIQKLPDFRDVLLEIINRVKFKKTGLWSFVNPNQDKYPAMKSKGFLVKYGQDRGSRYIEILGQRFYPVGDLIVLKDLINDFMKEKERRRGKKMT